LINRRSNARTAMRCCRRASTMIAACAASASDCAGDGAAGADAGEAGAPDCSCGAVADALAAGGNGGFETAQCPGEEDSKVDIVPGHAVSFPLCIASSADCRPKQKFPYSDAGNRRSQRRPRLREPMAGLVRWWPPLPAGADGEWAPTGRRGIFQEIPRYFSRSNVLGVG
jgi:hypothetical protein